MKVFILNALESGLDLINMLQENIELAGVIGLTHREPSDTLSGFIYLEEACKRRNLRFIPVEDYALRGASDRRRLSVLDIDVLVVAGWQRLIPEWLINKCRICAIGIHGGMEGIHGGRGRSPQNWSLLLGKPLFSVSIFKIDPAVDSGDIIDTAEFALSLHDDIRTSYHKCTLAAARMIVHNLLNGRIERQQFTPQLKGACYLPQRLPEDGAIDWNRSSSQVHNFVRALTRPYPGAYSRRADGRLIIWRGIPFESGARSSANPGKIVRFFSTGDFLVATSDGSYLVQEYTLNPIEPAIHEGEHLQCFDFRQQMRIIVQRHQLKYPDLPLAKSIIEAAELGPFSACL